MRPCNVPSTGDGGKTKRGDADNVSMCKSSCEPVAITDFRKYLCISIIITSPYTVI